MTNELYYLSIAETGALLKSKQLSPIELTNAFLDRIEAIDSRIHSFVLVTQEEALRRTVEWQWANPLEKYDPKEFDYATEDAALAELQSAAHI